MRVVIEAAVVVEVVVVVVATTENADHHLTTKTDRGMIGHVHVLILHVSLKDFLVTIFDISTLFSNPVFF